MEKKLKDIRREYVKKYFTGNLGKTFEADGKLFCYVNKRKCKKDDTGYYLKCKGIVAADKQIANIYGLNNKIVYIIDGLTIKKSGLNIIGEGNCDIIIKDSIFRDLTVFIDGDCSLSNVQVSAVRPLLISSKNIEIENCNLRNYSSLYGLETVVELEAGKHLKIDNSILGKNDEVAKVNLVADRIDIKNSKLRGNELLLSASEIDIDEDTKMTANQEILFKTAEIEDFKVYAPRVIYDISKNGNQKVLKLVNRER